MFRIQFSIKRVITRTLIVITPMVILVITGCAKPAESLQQITAEDPQNAVASLVSNIENGKVQSVEILDIPADIMTNHALSPQELQMQYSYKITISRLGSSRQEKSLVAALKATKVARTKRKTDLRWGVLFRSDKGQIQAIYLDGFGQFGQIDEVPVSFEGGIYGWLQSFSVCLK